MKNYYGWFIYNDTEYVIHFKIKGSLRWHNKHRCFQDSQWYVRTFEELLWYAAFDRSPQNSSEVCCCRITYKQFNEYLKNGIKNWKPERKIIVWWN